MKRNLGFDIARSFSMFYIVGVLHLSGYTGMSIAENSACVSLIWSTLGVFTFLSAFLLASRYKFSSISETRMFYKKRLLRFYPLFLLSSLALVAIDFNSWHDTWKALLGLSPFWKPQPSTLWYIATLIFMYLVTPILTIGKKKTGILNFFVILLVVFFVDYYFHSVDPRFYYYFVIYEFGIIMAKHFSQICLAVLSSRWTTLMVVPYIFLLIIIMLMNNRICVMGGGYLGILVIMNISLLIAEKVKNSKIVMQTVSFISYGSMCAYLFHREIYWLFLKLWTPQGTALIWLYLFLIAFPVTICLSYYIQKGYDTFFK